MGGRYSEVRNASAVLNPLFDYTTKYLLYKPAVLFYDRIVFSGYEIGERHWGFLHSFLELGTATVLTAIYMVPVLVFLDLVWVLGMGILLVGYLSAAILHPLEDNATRSGRQWYRPFRA